MSQAALPTAVLFDLDDTLITYGTAAERGWQMLAGEYAGRCGLAADDLLDAIRRSSAAFWADPARHRAERVNMFEARRKVISAAVAGLAQATEELVIEMATRRTSLALDLLELFPGALELVQRLHQHGVKLGMVTNGTASEQWHKIDRFGLRDFFGSIVVEGEFGRGKPDREVFEHVLDRLDVAPGETWMVGDNLAMDIAPAQALGMFAVWHDWRTDGLPGNAPCTPDRVIERIAELL
ncbi:MAG: HAD family hydrolase [Planctomycetota bacterium]